MLRGKALTEQILVQKLCSSCPIELIKKFACQGKKSLPSVSSLPNVAIPQGLDSNQSVYTSCAITVAAWAACIAERGGRWARTETLQAMECKQLM